MNEDHVLAAILTAGLIARGSDDNLQPKDAGSLYEMTLASLIATNRGQRPEAAE